MDEFFNDIVVVKRSGQRVPFNSLKIAVAIKAAFDNTLSQYIESDVNRVFEDTIKYIKDNYQTRKTINVEDIQDIIEQILKQDKYLDIYKAFSEYRIRRAESRKAFSEKQQHKFVKAIEKIGSINSAEFKAINSLSEYGSTIATEYNKSYVLDNKYVRAHEEGKIFIHNLAYFNIGLLNDTHININNYLNEDNDILGLSDILNNIKQEIVGEIAIDNFDISLNKHLLSKYKKVYEQLLFKYLEVMGFNNLLNIKKVNEIIAKSTGYVIEFSSYPEMMNNEVIRRVIDITEKDTKETITSYLSRSINALFNSLEVNSTNEHYSFSIGNLNDDIINNIIINEINKLPRLKNITIIYKLNKDAKLMENVATLILNGKNILIQNNNHDTSYFSNAYLISDSLGKSNITKVSINLARLGLKYHALSEAFFSELDEVLDLAKSVSGFIFETIGDKYKENYKYLFNGNILDDEKLEANQHIRKVIKSGTLAINLIGLKECAMAIDNNYEEVIIKILNYLNASLIKLKQESKYNYTLSSINEIDASTYMLELDKTIFGNVSGFNKINCYENIGDIIKIDPNYINNLNNILDGGVLIDIKIKNNVNLKHLLEILNDISSCNDGIYHIELKEL